MPQLRPHDAERRLDSLIAMPMIVVVYPVWQIRARERFTDEALQLYNTTHS